MTTLPIADIEARAKSAGVSMNDLCSRAGISRSTWTRWKSGVAKPLKGNWDQVVEVLVSAESALEAPKQAAALNA